MSGKERLNYKRGEIPPGTRRGKLVVERFSHREPVFKSSGAIKDYKYWYVCRCEKEYGGCGKENFLVMHEPLIREDGASGTSRSCGCGRSDDIIGKKMGKLTVVAEVPNKVSPDGSRIFRCVCDKGHEVELERPAIRKRRRVGCGQCFEMVKDISGQTFGYLTASRPTGVDPRGYAIWLFQCAAPQRDGSRCAKQKEIAAFNVVSGNTQSCGCLRKWRK